MNEPVVIGTLTGIVVGFVSCSILRSKEVNGVIAAQQNLANIMKEWFAHDKITEQAHELARKSQRRLISLQTKMLSKLEQENEELHETLSDIVDEDEDEDDDDEEHEVAMASVRTDPSSISDITENGASSAATVALEMYDKMNEVRNFVDTELKGKLSVDDINMLQAMLPIDKSKVD